MPTQQPLTGSRTPRKRSRSLATGHQLLIERHPMPLRNLERCPQRMEHRTYAPAGHEFETFDPSKLPAKQRPRRRFTLDEKLSAVAWAKEHGAQAAAVEVGASIYSVNDWIAQDRRGVLGKPKLQPVGPAVVSSETPLDQAESFSSVDDGEPEPETGNDALDAVSEIAVEPASVAESKPLRICDDCRARHCRFCVDPACDCNVFEHSARPDVETVAAAG